LSLSAKAQDLRKVR